MDTMAVEKIRELVLTGETLEELKDNELEALTFEKVTDMISGIMQETSEDEQASPLGKIAWCARWSYIAGFIKALEAYSEGIEGFIAELIQE